MAGLTTGLSSLTSGSKSLTSLTSMLLSFNNPALGTSYQHIRISLSALEIHGWGWTLVQHSCMTQGSTKPGCCIGAFSVSQEAHKAWKEQLQLQLEGFQWEIPSRYIFWLATYLSANLYLCLCLCETDFRWDGRCGRRGGSFSFLDN